ncbi:acyl-ACP--UDP-N-acetylglucosamine O-acyltransferase [Puniceicoccaceae bacterium K14]|nr:acyl-ACP--UDP-N-acetylglucosamine O-acyltransferase [Puniceicoccaceae bacterium K14]
MIHETAVISPQAKIGENVEISAFALIEGDVEIGDETKVGPHAVLKNGSRIGVKVTIDAHAVIAGLPQDLSFDPETVSYVKIGDETVIREGVTISRATRIEEATTVGSNCYLMAGSHVGHDSQVGDNVILANIVMLAGHVQVGDHTFIGGGAGIHQYGRIGRGAMVSGLTAASQDVPPFSMVADRNDLVGLNLVGLKRRGHSREAIRSIKHCFSEVFGRVGNIKKIAEELKAEEEAQSDEAQEFLTFIIESKRGVVRPRKEGLKR